MYNFTLCLMSALDGGGGQRHAPPVLLPRERNVNNCIGDWMGPRVGMNRCGKSRLPRDSIRTFPSQRQYQLSYPGPRFYSAVPLSLLILFSKLDLFIIVHIYCNVFF
jgi:hypothetical protein